MKQVAILLILLSFALAACSSAPAAQPVPVADEINEQPSAGATIVIEAPELADNKVYSANLETTVLNWKASRIAATPHVGTVPLQSGSLVRENNEFVSGEFVLDMTAMTADGDRVLQHLKSADFFDVETYPTATFVITSMTANDDGRYLVTGDLTILDSTNEISFDATLENVGEELVMTASFAIDRTRWGITYDSGSIFSDLGDRAIKDEIDYDLYLVLQ